DLSRTSVPRPTRDRLRFSITPRTVPARPLERGGRSRGSPHPNPATGTAVTRTRIRCRTKGETMRPMHPIARPARALGAGIVAGLSLLMVALAAAPSWAATPSTFTTMRQPISIASLPQRLVATRFCSDRIFAINQTGAISTFATLPSTGNSCLARDVVVSPGLGGVAQNNAVALPKPTIYRMPANGSTVQAFATISSLDNSETSLTFDTVGTFGFNLIATDRLGTIWRITAAGVATKFTDVGHHIEGAQVAPMGFTPFGGQL